MPRIGRRCRLRDMVCRRYRLSGKSSICCLNWVNRRGWWGVEGNPFGDPWELPALLSSSGENFDISPLSQAQTVLNRKKRITFPEILLKSSTCLFTQLSLRIRSWVFCRKLANSNVCKRLTGGVAPSTFRNPKKL